MKNKIDDLNSWLYHRIRMCIWKQWKLPKTKKRNLMKLGIPEYFAHQAANSRRKYWYVSGMGGGCKKSCVYILYMFFEFLHTDQALAVRGFSWALPTPGLQNKAG